ncbi:MAG: hypothetical protein IJ009_06240 [Clostridia bacterium]|nr:hypothetical protein [Clostridia bacterium]
MKALFRISLLLLCAAMLFACTPTVPPTGGDEGDDPPTNEAPLALTPFLHISFDDVEHCFRNLKEKNYASIWEEPFLAALREAREGYGATFSLYVWKDILHDQPSCYQIEWQAASDWLKIGLHSDGDGNFAEADYTRGKTEWEHFVSDVYAMTGSYDCIDRIPRLHNFAGSAEALRGMSEAAPGALGFLAADDTRISYDLTAEENAVLLESDYLFYNNRVYLPTDVRFENYREQSIYEILAQKWGATPTDKCFILFTHEYEVYDGTAMNKCFSWIDEAALYFGEKNIPFAFPQDFSYAEK